MKKLLFALLLSVISSQAMAVGANDIRLMQRNTINTGNQLRSLSFPPSNANGVLVLDGASSLPKVATLTGGLTYNGTSLGLSAIPSSSISGLTSALAAKMDVPAGTTLQYIRGDGSLATFPSTSVAVSSFNGRTGAILPVANDYGVADIGGLSTVLAAKAATIHTHTASDTTSGTFSDGRIAASNVTQHQAALSIGASQVTGTKTSAFVSDFGLASRAAQQCVSGTTQKLGCFPVIKSSVVASGVAVFHLTTDGTSSGAALFPNGPDKDSVQTVVNDATASYQYGWVWSNSDKTLTVTTNKLTTANILTGLLGQAAANGSTVKLIIFGN